MKHPLLWLLGGLMFLSAPVLEAQESAVYVVTFKSTWTEKTHPFEYPEAGLFTGPHFSGLIGASHASGYSLFKEGAMPTPGLEKLSEEGKHAPLDEEIRIAITSGNAGSLFETGPIKDHSKTEMTEVHLTTRYPMVSAVAMIAPSPDWFAGVANVNLMEDGKWVTEKKVELYPWDSGGDDGTTYEAADLDTNPKKATMKASVPCQTCLDSLGVEIKVWFCEVEGHPRRSTRHEGTEKRLT